MKTVKVLGSGCQKCTDTAKLIQQTADELSVSVNVIKETDLEVIMSYAVMSTPAIVLDEQVVHSGSMPTKQQIGAWLTAN